ncbi:syntaxin [Trypanosoma cruzi]|nr:syntaxin [Trypanosoma cruzi]
MKREAMILQRLAVKDGKLDEYLALMMHVHKIEGLQREHCGGKPDDDVSREGMNEVAVAGATPFTYSAAIQELAALLLSLNEDEEFTLFLDQIKLRDPETNQAFDRIGKRL